MAKAKGSPKTGGRMAGTPNKATKVLRECITNVVEVYVSKPDPGFGDWGTEPSLWGDLRTLSAAERVKAIITLANFVLPKPQTSVDDTE